MKTWEMPNPGVADPNKGAQSMAVQFYDSPRPSAVVESSVQWPVASGGPGHVVLVRHFLHLVRESSREAPS